MENDPNSLIYVPCPRVNCLKSIPFTAADIPIYSPYMAVRRQGYTAVARLGLKRRATAVPNSIHKL